MPLAATVAFALFGLDALAQLVLVLSDPQGVGQAVTQALLMPLLALGLVLSTRSPRGRLVTGTLAALGFSFLGDTLPALAGGETGFLVLVACFLVAQVVYSVTFWPYRAGSVALTSSWLLLPYAAAFVALVLACRDGAGSLFVPVVVYGFWLTTMAVLATGVSRLAGVGGAVFMVSDALIALLSFTDVRVPASGFWVMLTYVVGQALLVAGVLERSRSTADTGADAAPAAQGSRSSR